MAKKRKVTEEDALSALAGSLGITQKDIDEANKNSFSQRCAAINVPCELRLGQAIVNALGHLHKRNPTIPEDFSTALYYVSDKELQEAIDAFHKPYGFGSR